MCCGIFFRSRSEYFYFVSNTCTILSYWSCCKPTNFIFDAYSFTLQEVVGSAFEYSCYPVSVGHRIIISVVIPILAILIVSVSNKLFRGRKVLCVLQAWQKANVAKWKHMHAQNKSTFIQHASYTHNYYTVRLAWENFHLFFDIADAKDFLCSYNVLSVHSSLMKPTRERVKCVLDSSLLICFV